MTVVGSIDTLFHDTPIPWDIATQMSRLFDSQAPPFEVSAASVEVADRLRRRGELARAEVIYRQALEALSGTVDADFEVAQAYRGLATILASKREFDKAAFYFERAIDALDRCRSTRRGVLAYIVKNVAGIAYLLREQGKLHLAEKLLRENLAALRSASHATPHDIVSARCDLAHVLRQRGNLREAQDHYAAALRAQQAMYGWDHPNTRKTRRNLTVLLRQLGGRLRLGTVRQQIDAIASGTATFQPRCSDQCGELE